MQDLEFDFDHTSCSSQMLQYTVSQKTSHLWLAIILTCTVRLR